MASYAGAQRSISAVCSTSRLSPAVPVRILGMHSDFDASAYNDCSLVCYAHRYTLVSNHRHHLHHRQDALAPSAVQHSHNSQAVSHTAVALHLVVDFRFLEFYPHSVAVGEFHHSKKFLCCLFRHRSCCYLITRGWYRSFCTSITRTLFVV